MDFTGFRLIGPDICDDKRETGFFLVGGEVHGPQGATGYRVRDDRFLDRSGTDSGFRFKGNLIFGPSTSLPWK